MYDRAHHGEPIGCTLVELLKPLKLGALVDTHHSGFLEQHLADEASRRESRSAALRARKAGLDPAMRIDTWHAAEDLIHDHTILADLTSLRFIDVAHSAFHLGPVGVGKTRLSTALGHMAIGRRRSETNDFYGISSSNDNNAGTRSSHPPVARRVVDHYRRRPGGPIGHRPPHPRAHTLVTEGPTYRQRHTAPDLTTRHWRASSMTRHGGPMLLANRRSTGLADDNPQDFSQVNSTQDIRCGFAHIPFESSGAVHN